MRKLIFILNLLTAITVSGNDFFSKQQREDNISFYFRRAVLIGGVQTQVMDIEITDYSFNKYFFPLKFSHPKYGISTICSIFEEAPGSENSIIITSKIFKSAVDCEKQPEGVQVLSKLKRFFHTSDLIHDAKVTFGYLTNNISVTEEIVTEGVNSQSHFFLKEPSSHKN